MPQKRPKDRLPNRNRYGARMSKSAYPPSEALYPTPVVLVSSINRRTKQANIITIAWCGIVCSQPPQISISIRPSRLSHAAISETGEFVINIPTREMLAVTDLCGMRSGRDANKFKLCGFTADAASKVSAPLIKECPVNIECKVVSTQRLGTHDMFIGEVLAVHVDDSIKGRDGKIDYAKAKPFVYNQGEYWDLDKKIGFYGCSARK